MPYGCSRALTGGIMPTLIFRGVTPGQYPAQLDRVRRRSSALCSLGYLDPPRSSPASFRPISNATLPAGGITAATRHSDPCRMEEDHGIL
jgi:hypothetical protein